MAGERIKIGKYSFGSITVDGRTYDQDLIVFPGRVSPDWWRAEGHLLQNEDLDEVFRFDPDYLVVGQGNSGRMQISPEVRRRLKEEEIELISQNTESAIEIFNQKNAAGAKVVGAFHLTC